MQAPLVDPNPITLPHSDPTSLSAYAHDRGVALGKELGVMFGELPSVAAIQRVIENTKKFAEHLLEVEKRSQRIESTTSRVFTTGGGAVSSPGLP